MSERAVVGIEVTAWSPVTVSEPADGPAVVRISVEESFSGDIEGVGAADLLQVLRADGSASFVAIERVTATLAGRSGSFVLQDAGTLAADGVVDGDWFVVAGSATGELSGLRGTGGFRAKVGERAEGHLDYSFE